MGSLQKKVLIFVITPLDPPGGDKCQSFFVEEIIFSMDMFLYISAP